MKGLREVSTDVLSETSKVIVAGDIHGDYAGFRNMLEHFNPIRDCLVLLGDYADRGRKGMEVIGEVRNLTIKHPNRVYALKGNHEDYTADGRPKFTPCSLKQEAARKTGSWRAYFENELKPFTDSLCLAAIIPNQVLFVHGGVSNKIKSLRNLKSPSKDVEEDILWSDPFEGYGERFNRRGAGVEFGKDISKKVCRRLGVKRVVRSHQPRKAIAGPYVEHEGKLITISSTSVYGGTPFILKLPAKNFGESFNNLDNCVQNLL